MDKLWLGSHVIGVFHRVRCVDHIHLQRTKITEVGVPRVPDRRPWSQSGEAVLFQDLQAGNKQGYSSDQKKKIKRRTCQLMCNTVTHPRNSACLTFIYSVA